MIMASANDERLGRYSLSEPEESLSKELAAIEYPDGGGVYGNAHMDQPEMPEYNPVTQEAEVDERVEKDKYDGHLKIYLPDGHLEKGGLRAIWEMGTGLPYPSNEQYIISFTPDEIVERGFPRDAVGKLSLILRRPHDIPASVRRYGVGITGEDFIRDRLGIGLTNGYKNGLEKGLTERGLMHGCDLQCRPSNIVMAFPMDMGIGGNNDVMSKFLDNSIMIATEYPKSTEDYSKNELLVPTRIIETAGKTEAYPLVGESDGIFDVAETGHSLIRNGLRAIMPIALEGSTPRTIFNGQAYGIHREFLDDLVVKLEYGRELVRSGNLPAWQEEHVNFNNPLDPMAFRFRRIA